MELIQRNRVIFWIIIILVCIILSGFRNRFFHLQKGEQHYQRNQIFQRDRKKFGRQVRIVIWISEYIVLFENCVLFCSSCGLNLPKCDGFWWWLSCQYIDSFLSIVEEMIPLPLGGTDWMLGHSVYIVPVMHSTEFAWGAAEISEWLSFGIDYINWINTEQCSQLCWFRLTIKWKHIECRWPCRNRCCRSPNCFRRLFTVSAIINLYNLLFGKITSR